MGIDVDKDVAMMAEVYGLQDDIAHMSPVVAKRNLTKEFLDGNIFKNKLKQSILKAVNELEKKYDLLIIEGTGHTGVGSIFNLNNATVAAMIKATPLLVTDGGIGKSYDQLILNSSLYDLVKRPVKFILLNRLLEDKRTTTLEYIKLAYKKKPVSVLGGLNYSQILGNPTLNDISRLFKQPLKGDNTDMSRIIYRFHMGAAGTQKVVENLKKNTLIILANTRDELMVTLAGLYQIPEYQNKIGGIIISGTGDNSPRSQEIIAESNIPYFRVKKPIGEIFELIKNYVAKLSSHDTEKISLIQSMFEEHLKFEDIEKKL